MITPQELQRFELFSGLNQELCERLCRQIADISVPTGEVLMYEGDGKALFGVIRGRFEGSSSMIDGPAGKFIYRDEGELMGEMSMAFGMPQPSTYRATETSRVFRIDPNNYYSIIAEVPEVGERLGRIAFDRISGPTGLHALLASSTPIRAIVLGRRNDPDCAELRRFIDRNQIPFEWLDPDIPTDMEKWSGSPPAEGDYPLLRVVNGKTVVRPQLRRVAELLDLETEPKLAEYDTVVVGAGPAGLAAAVYGASEGLSTLVVECDAPGGQAGTSSRIENYLGFPSGVSGGELSSRALKQARRLGAEILVTRKVTRIDANTLQVHLDGGDVICARTIILASGVSWRALSIEGFDRLVGKGIFYGASRSEAPNTQGLDIHIIGAGNSAGQAAMFFSTYAKSVTMLVRGDNLEKSMSQYLIEQLALQSNIHVRFKTEATGAFGEECLEEIEVRDKSTGETTRLPSSRVFIFIGADAETGWLPPEIALSDKGFVLTGSDARATGNWPLERDPYLLETSVPGIFASGDVRLSPVKRVAAAVGEGSMAIAFVHQYLSDKERSKAR